MAHLTKWIGIDDHADKLTIALYVGPQKQPAKEWEVAPTEAGLRQLVRWIKELKGPVHCVYEAGPCYELYRLLVSKKVDCVVAAPSLTPRKPGERIKTNRRDARKLAEFHRGRYADADRSARPPSGVGPGSATGARGRTEERAQRPPSAEQVSPAAGPPLPRRLDVESRTLELDPIS